MVYNIDTMKNIKDEINEILVKAERDLQQLIAKAAEVGDYRGVDTARSVAVKINEIQRQIIERGIVSTSFSKKMEAGGKVKTGKRKSVARKGKKGGYPKFEVKKDTLIRIGWSKKQKREYSHKLSRAIFDLTVNSMESLAKNSAGPFMAEEIIEKVNKAGTDIPSYQIYVMIGMLKKMGCIKQVGREGYQISNVFKEKAENTWMALQGK